jgi:glycosyltransferase involved in cell wall biosynthesis
VIAASSGPLVAKAAAFSEVTVIPFPKSVARLGEWGARGSTIGRLHFAAGLLAASGPAISYARQLHTELRRRNPHIIHSNGLKMHLLGARARPHGTKLVWHLHDYPAARRLAARLLAAEAHRCDGMFANSESVAADARERFGPSIPVHTLYNSVDLTRFSPTGPRADLDAVAQIAPLPPGGVRMGLVATFARWKGHGVFLDALARLRDMPNVRGYVIGGPIYETNASQYSAVQLRAHADMLGLGDRVAFTGKIDDVPAALRALDIAVHASTEPEPFGLVIAEAMACGRPVVVSRAGGAAEIAQAGAVFHQPGNSAELADRLRELAGDSARRESLGREGRAAALRLFSRAQLCTTLLPVYEALAGARA